MTRSKLRRLLPALALVAAVLPLVTPAHADTGLSTTGVLTTPVMAAFHGKTPPELFGGAVVGDVDGDKQPDIVAGYQDGHVYAWHENGSRFLDIKTTGAIRTAPSLIDINGDGVADILTAGSDGSVWAYNGKGHPLFHVTTPAKFGLVAIFSAPTAVDLDGDGKKEIIATSWDHYLWAWDLAGHVKKGFPLYLEDTAWSSPAIGDINGDGHPDIVFGYDCVGVKGQTCTTKYHQGGGLVGAVDLTGKMIAGYPVFVPGQVVWSTPALADINGDGKLDVVAGTGLYSASPAGSQVWAWDGAGHKLSGFPLGTHGRVMASPAVGDIDGDGKADISVMDEVNNVWAWSGSGHLLPGFPVCGSNSGTCNTRSPGHASDVLADVTGDGKVDVVAVGQTVLHVWDGAGNLEGSLAMPKGTIGVTAAPTVATLSGHAEVLMSSMLHQPDDNYSGTIVRASFGKTLGPAPWPQFRQNLRGSGHVDDLVAPALATIDSTSASNGIIFDLKATDADSGVAGFEAYYRINNGSLVHWFSWAPPNSHSGTTYEYRRKLGTHAGDTVRIQVRSRDHQPNVSGWYATTVTAPAF